jgi:hypothetical protein
MADEENISINENLKELNKFLEQNKNDIVSLYLNMKGRYQCHIEDNPSAASVITASKILSVWKQLENLKTDYFTLELKSKRDGKIKFTITVN